LQFTVPNFQKDDFILLDSLMPAVRKVSKKSNLPQLSTKKGTSVDSGSFTDGSQSKMSKKVKRPRLSLADNESLDARRKNNSIN
jgi:hypothetical protein